MEINKYGIDPEKLNSQLKDVAILSPHNNANSSDKTYGSILKDAFDEVNTHQKTPE